MCMLLYSLCICTEYKPRALTSGSSPGQRYKPWNNFLLHQHTFALYAL